MDPRFSDEALKEGLTATPLDPAPPPPPPAPPGPWALALGGVGDCVIFVGIVLVLLAPAIIAKSKVWVSGISHHTDVMLVIVFALSPAAMILTLVLRWLRWRRTDPSWPVWFGSDSARHAALGAFMGVLALLGATVYYWLAEKFFHYDPDKDKWAQELLARIPLMGTGLKLLLIAGLAVLAPFAEETYFRGMLLRSFVKSGHTVFGVIVSSALFAVLHLEGAGLLHKFAFGIMCAWLYLRTGSLTASMVAHATNNGIVGLFMIFQKYIVPHAAKLPHHS